MSLKHAILIVTLASFSILLSSCTFNTFKGVEKAQSAFSAYKNGDFEKAITLSAISFENISGGSFNSEGFYDDVITSDSTSNVASRDKLASLSNFLNTTSSTNVVLRLDSEAMLESISNVLKIDLASVSKIFSSTVTTTSSNVNVNLIRGLEIMLSLPHNSQLMYLLESLSMTLHRFEPSNPNWLLSVGIYSFLEVPIVLFDSNDNDVLNPKDMIYSYLWNSTTNAFKKNITSEDYDHIFNGVNLGTYENVKKSSIVIHRLSLTVTALDKALNEMINSSTQNTVLLMNLRRYVGQIEVAMYMLDPVKLSKVRCLGELMNFLM